MSWTGVITNAGQALLDQWAEGGHTLTIDKAAVGSGLTDAADMLTATNLANQQALASIISKSAVAGGTKFKILISPAATTAYTARELGLWAHIDNGSSVLMSLHQDETGGVAVPTQAQSPDFAFAMYIIHAISNTEELEVTVDPSAYVPLSMFTEAVEDLEGADATMQTAITSLSTNKLDKTGATTNNTAAFTSGDAADADVSRSTGWSAVSALTSGLTHTNLFNRISTMMKNVRWLYKMLGTTDISTLSTAGTVTGALAKLNTDLTNIGTIHFAYVQNSYVSESSLSRLYIRNVGKLGVLIGNLGIEAALPANQQITIGKSSASLANTLNLNVAGQNANSDVILVTFEAGGDLKILSTKNISSGWFRFVVPVVLQ